MNPAFEKVFGWTAEELIGKQIDFVPEQSRVQTGKAVQKVLAGEQVYGFETTRVTKDKRTIHVRLTASALKTERDEFNGIVVTLQDISELVESRQQAIAANEIKNNFLSNISHEIRTPMNGLMGILELLANTNLDDEQHEYIDVLQKSAARLMEIINNILDFSRIESGTVEKNAIDFDLRVQINTISDLMKPKASRKGLEFKVSVHQQVPSLLVGDPEKLRQILIHLIGNAVKFTDKGDIRLEVSLLSESDKEATIKFEIKDSGIGIPQDQLTTIFQSFSQGDDSATRRYGGVGIGLPISHKLAGILGGRIHVESREKKGSAFSFELVFKRQEPVLSTGFDISKNISGKSILVVDDDQATRLILKEMTQLWGCRFEEAANSKRALEKLSACTPDNCLFDVIIIDMALEDQGAEKLCAQIRSKGLSQVILVVLAENGKPGDVARLKAVGAQGYLPKPVDPSLLLECINIAPVLKAQGKDLVINRHYLQEIKKSRVKILLMDPERTNGKIVKNILLKSGYFVEYTDDASTAVKWFESGGFNLILVGFGADGADVSETVKKIRSLAKKENKLQIVMIGMRSDLNPVPEDEKLDDIIVKPITAGPLLAAVEKWSSRIERSLKPVDPVKKMRQTRPRTDVFNFKSALERAMNDMSFLEEIVMEFSKTLPDKFQELKQAVNQNDLKNMTLRAHSLRGSCSNVGADRIVKEAQKLEKAFDVGDLDSAAGIMKQMEEEIDRFCNNIKMIDWSDI